MISERARPLVRAALEKRLKEVSGERAGQGSAASGRPGTGSGTNGVGDPEEALRKLMVTLLPRLGALDAGGRAELCSLLLSLEEAAKGDDIRFLDAWNAIHEGALPREAFLADPAWRAVLEAYARVLEAAIAKLSG